MINLRVVVRVLKTAHSLRLSLRLSQDVGCNYLNILKTLRILLETVKAHQIAFIEDRILLSFALRSMLLTKINKKVTNLAIIKFIQFLPVL